MSTTSIPGIVLEGDTARARRTDPPQSHSAADGTAKKRELSWLLIEQSLAANAPMTAMGVWEFVNFRLGKYMSTSRATTGVTELARLGVIVPAGMGKNPSGYKAQLWTLAGAE